MRLTVYRDQVNPRLFRLERPGDAASYDTFDLRCDEPAHLRTWLMVQLQAAGRGRGQAVFDCEVSELEALASDFQACSMDKTLREKTATEALSVRQHLTDVPANDELRQGLLSLAHAWGNEAAGPLLLERLVRQGRFDEARTLLDSLSLGQGEWKLSAAELAVLQENFVEALGHLNGYLDLALEAKESFDAQAVVQVLQTCLQYPQLADLLKHPCVELNRSILRQAAQEEEYTVLADVLKPSWQVFAQRNYKLLAGFGAAAVAAVLFRHQVVPVLLVLLLPLGALSLAFTILRRFRKK